jgi:hypothetical protein
MTRSRELAELATAYDTGTPLGFRNRIINGDMRIDQRNAGASVTLTASSYTLDRWRGTTSVSSKYSIQQNAGSVTPPVSFTNYLGVTSLSAYSVGSGEAFTLLQRVEGFNCSDLNWGSANAKTVTLSFQVYSSLTGTFGGSLQNSAANRSYPFTYTVSSANTWTTVSVTVPGDTSGTWLTDNGTGIVLFFSLGTGSTLSGTAGSWAGANYLSATGAVSVVGTDGATFYITGVQLEAGSVATPFERRPYSTELQLAQRYFEVFGSGGVGGTRLANTTWTMNHKFQVTKRAAPTVTQLASYTVLVPGVTGTSSSSINAQWATVSGTQLNIVVASAASASNGQVVVVADNDTSGNSLAASSEL